MRYARYALALVVTAFVASCGDTTAPEQGEIVDLVIQLDSMIFVEEGVDLREAVFGVTASGDSVPLPEGTTFTLPDGFRRDGDMLRADREAVGMIVASLNPSDSAQVQAAHHLDSLAPWHAEWDCYEESTQHNRDGEGIMYSRDSMDVRVDNGGFEYVDRSDFTGAIGQGDVRVVNYWEDGQVDTVLFADEQFMTGVEHHAPDTLLIGATDTWLLPATASDPRRYDHPGGEDEGKCSSGWTLGGSFVLVQQ